jgi:ATP-binding cassette subfamily B protein
MEQLKMIVKEVKAKAWLKRETRPYGTRVFFLAVLTVATTAFTLAFAYLVRYLINSATAGDSKQLWIFSGILLATLLLKILLKTLNGYYAEKLRAKIYTGLQRKTFAKILRCNYAGVQQYHSGELITRLTSDIQEISVDTVGLTPALAGMVVQCLGAIAALLTIDPIFTLIYVVCGALFGAITALFRRQIKKKHKEVLEADEKSRAFMHEGVSSIMTIKAYGAEHKTDEKVAMLSDIYYYKRLKRNALRMQMSFVFNLLSNFGLIFAIVWCSVSVLHGNNDYGAILSVVLLLIQLQQPLTSASTIIPVFYSRIASAERLAELDEIQPEELSKNTSNPFAIYETIHSIQLKNLSFSYDRDAIFDEANAEFKKGEIVCLTGASGSGKSTLFKLLLDVFKPTEGAIFLCGENNQTILTAKERVLFAYVPQGNFLFSGTIYENLTFFTDAPITDEDLRQAITTACAEFVYDLPDGLNTRLAEGGEGLSEGQLLRLAVARAVLSKRPILLLDEATSALDAETEKKLLENIQTLTNKTCLIVTHRPAALDIADRILNVEDKKIFDVK